MLLLPFIGCVEHRPAVRQAGPPVVVVARPTQQDVQHYFTTTGTTQASEFNIVPARVSGQLKEIYYTPGAIVFEGDPLFLIEQDQYQANVDSAKASLISAEATESTSKITYERTKSLLPSAAVSQQDVDLDEMKWKQAQAAVLSAKAQLQKAELDLKYTYVLAPNSGKTEQNLQSKGALVGTNVDNTILTSVAQLNPIYVYFDVSNAQANEFRKLQAEVNDDFKTILEKLKQTNQTRQKLVGELGTEAEIENLTSSHPEPKEKKEENPLFAKIVEDAKSRQSVDEYNLLVSVGVVRDASGEIVYEFDGIVDLSSNRGDLTTDTIQFRGQIPNEEYILYPGQNVYVRVPTFVEKDAILIPETAIGTDLNRKYVMVVDDKNIANRRDVELGPTQPGSLRIIRSGLSTEDKIIVRGIQKAKEGKPVTIEAGVPAK
jgi:membrane fusion protein (multidrug efflux system)